MLVESAQHSLLKISCIQQNYCFSFFIIVHSMLDGTVTRIIMEKIIAFLMQGFVPKCLLDALHKSFILS